LRGLSARPGFGAKKLRGIVGAGFSDKAIIVNALLSKPNKKVSEGVREKQGNTRFSYPNPRRGTMAGFKYWEQGDGVTLIGRKKCAGGNDLSSQLTGKNFGRRRNEREPHKKRKKKRVAIPMRKEGPEFSARKEKRGTVEIIFGK